MIVAIHQPDLLPYSGFWFKMATADVFVVAVHDQFQKHGYQRRVTMRGKWCSHQLVGKPSLVPIEQVEVAEGWQQRLGDVIRGRYAASPHWRTRGPDLVERISSCEGTTLDQVNLAMVRVVRDLLGLTTELVVTDPPASSGIDRLIEQVAMVGGTEYVSGAGGAAYLGADAAERFADHGITLRWSQHVPTSPDSVVTALLDHDRPIDVVRRAS